MERRAGSTDSSADLVEPTVPSRNNHHCDFITNSCFMIWKRIKETLSIVTVEPVLFFYMLATFMQYSVFQDLVYQKTCQNNFNESVCQHLNDNPEALDQVQKQASHWILGSTVSLTVPSIIVANYLGSFSDLYDRKWPLIFPALGMVLACIVYILMSLFGAIPVGFIVLASFLSGIFGGFVSCIMAVMSYVSAVSSEESRGMRVAMLEAMTFCGGTVGPFLGGALLGATGSHAIVFTFILACYVLVVNYIIFCVPSIKHVEEVVRDVNGGDDPLLLARVVVASDRSRCRQLFTCHHFQASLATCFRTRSNHRRRNLLLLVTCALITMTITAGEMDVAYLFTKDDPLAWTYQTYSYYFGLKFGIGALSLIGFSPLVRLLGLSEGVTCCAGLVSKLAGLVLHGFATTSAMMMCVPFVSMLNTFCLPSIRSLLSKQVEPNELGKLFAFVASVENICTMMASIVFNSIYPLTRSFFKGFIFEIAAGFLLIPIIIMSYLSYVMKKDRLSYVSTDPSVVPASVRGSTSSDQ